MKMGVPTKVLISIKDNSNNFSSDVELPSHMPVKELIHGLLRLLRTWEPKKYAGCDTADLWFGDVKLKGDQTLASAGVWDGNELTLRVRKK